MYYAGFYSTYYTDYYVDWMYRKMSAENLAGGNADGNGGEMPPLKTLTYPGYISIKSSCFLVHITLKKYEFIKFL